MKFSASKTSLAHHCLWWAREGSPCSESVSSAASEGRERHAAIEQALIDGESHHPYGKSVLADRIFDHVITEIAFEFECVTGKAAVVDAKERSYARRPSCVYGTADAIMKTETGFLIVDWKTGSFPVKADGNGQLLTLAVMARSAMALTEPISVAIAHVTPDGVSWDIVAVDDIELDSHAEWLKKIPQSIESAKPNPGAHCRGDFCPSYGLCPATNEGAKLVAPSALNRKLATTSKEIANADHAAWQYQMLRQAQAAMNAAWAALTEYAGKTGGVVLPDGSTWGPSTTRRTQIEATPRALTAITNAVGVANASSAYSITITRAGVRSAARAKSAETGDSIAEIERRIMADLEAVGAVIVNETTTYKETKNDTRRKNCKT